MKAVCTVLALLLTFSSCSKPMPPDEAGEKIKKLLVLPAYEHIYRDIIYYNEERTLAIFRIYKKELLFTVNIRVQAGVDLQKGFRLVSDGPESVKVTLPRAEILLVDADETSINEMFITEINKDIQLMDYYREIDAKKDEIARSAVNGGILTKAEDNIRFMVENLLKAAGYEHVSVLFGGPEND